MRLHDGQMGFLLNGVWEWGEASFRVFFLIDYGLAGFEYIIGKPIFEHSGAITSKLCRLLFDGVGS